MPSNHLILCCPLLLLTSIFPNIRVFSNESAVCIRWPKYWNFSFSLSISPSNEYSGMVSSRIDWFDLLAVQGTLQQESFVQASSSAPQFENISLPSSFSLKNFKILTSLQIYWMLQRQHTQNLCTVHPVSLIVTSYIILVQDQDTADIGARRMDSSVPFYDPCRFM